MSATTVAATDVSRRVSLRVRRLRSRRWRPLSRCAKEFARILLQLQFERLPMRVRLLPVLLATFGFSVAAVAQSTVRDEQGLYLTVFRSPATGIEYRAGHAAAYT